MHFLIVKIFRARRQAITVIIEQLGLSRDRWRNGSHIDIHETPSFAIAKIKRRTNKDVEIYRVIEK